MQVFILSSHINFGGNKFLGKISPNAIASLLEKTPHQHEANH
ncbi:hypothetical protein [Calothrix sp. UHCC 0171]|nr:hypothetical protein [Calothrix sp. UHCC 0171]MEA5570646.1 hypothetical protein [Calothrix sp. UHCC 0171]